MTGIPTKVDRYITFEGIDCEERVRRIVAHIRSCIGDTAKPSPLHTYFAVKLDEIEGRGQDELYFVGSQVNPLRELFDHHGDAAAIDLLEQIEEECC